MFGQCSSDLKGNVLEYVFCKVTPSHVRVWRFHIGGGSEGDKSQQR